jgi:aminomethyltransferase
LSTGNTNSIGSDIAIPDAGQPRLRVTPLNALHKALNAKLVPFAGYEMPVQYPSGIMREHAHVREAAGLFDVSHMGQAVLRGPDFETAAKALEALVPGDILGLKPGGMRYTQLVNDRGGIIDDLMVTRPANGPQGHLHLVVNASRKDIDISHMAARLPAGVSVELREDAALLALQGPKAASVLAALVSGLDHLSFLSAADVPFNDMVLGVTRSGYTGEDGFEISVAADRAEDFARVLLADDRVLPIGLGARDSLRLEAGLCLYGQDMDDTVSPVEAALSFSIGKRRRKEGGFPGADRILRELDHGPARIRVGLVLEGRAAARQGVELREKGAGGVIGHVTSGAFTPTAAKSIAMGYVPPASAAPGTEIEAVIRGAGHLARVVPLPFVPHRYIRKPS